MKALTVCQPYAHLIMLPAIHPRHKRVENRTWSTNIRGPILIHAWLDIDGATHRDCYYDIPFGDMEFGTIVGTADLIDCLSFERIAKQAHDIGEYEYDALLNNKHVHGPWCFLLGNVRKFITPVPFRGAMGFFNARARC